MAKATLITQQQFEDFVFPLGFQLIQLPDVKELVYAKLVENDGQKLSLRIYSSITADGYSREIGADAIRVALFHRKKNNDIAIVGGDRRVHRVEGWRKNLAQRLEKWPAQLGPKCPWCGSPTNLREPRKGQNWKPFHGCCEFPLCRGVVSAAELADK